MRNDGKQQRMQGVLVGVGEPLASGQLKAKACSTLSAAHQQLVGTERRYKFPLAFGHVVS